jgi:hypothetical protein
VVVVVDDGVVVVVVLVDPVPVVVVVLPATVVVVDDGVVVVVVVVDAGLVVVVVVVVVGGTVVGGLSKIRSTVVPPLWCAPKRSARGRPAISSTAVMRSREKTKTAAATPATLGQRWPGALDRAGGSAAITAVAGSVRVVSCVSAVLTVCAVSCVFAVSSASSCPAALVAVASATGDGVVDSDAVTPAAPVPPKRRSKLVSGARTTTCLTAAFVFSIDWKRIAEPVVAAIDPIATPMIVPLTPKMDAMTADSTAPPAEASICR